MQIAKNKNLARWMLAGSVLAAGLATALPVAAQTPAGAQSEDVGTIIVTGTRRTDRSITDSASPVDVVSAADLRTQPAADLLDVVRNLVPSFFVGQNTISDASTFVRAPSLRGLGADQVLVQLNGKRYNRSALVQVLTGGDTALSFGSQGPDISAIPSLALSLIHI
jgi:iron complex outermembrane receptor protein